MSLAWPSFRAGLTDSSSDLDSKAHCCSVLSSAAKPMVLLLGQYSTGKTTFIKYLLVRDFPGSRIGPEPTTDKFTAVMYGEEKTVPGPAVSLQPDKPFSAVQRFGMAFLNRF